MSLLTKLLHKETATEKVRRLNFLRQKEEQAWEESSPDSAGDYITNANCSFRRCPKNSDRWRPLDQNSRYLSRRPPKWIMQLAERTWDTQLGKAVGVPIFLHRRFITYKIDYNDHEGYIILKGLKPSSITRIDSQLQKLHER